MYVYVCTYAIILIQLFPGTNRNHSAAPLQFNVVLFKNLIETYLGEREASSPVYIYLI